MSSNPQKQAPKMCKSPKTFQMKPNDSSKVILNEYESLNTNCTTIGSNNLHLVKKPQIVTNMSPAYSNPSPSYPQSPYSSPAGGMKSPSPQSMKPPTPQPNTFPVMQIIHNNHILARPIQTPPQQNIIKLKPHLNILPKPAASPQPSPKPSVSPQIVIPTNQQATIMPTAQPLLLPQMPVITTPAVQFILRPQTKLPPQMQAATPQGLILQPTTQPMLQIQPPRSQPLVRVLTNGVQLATPTTTYVTHLANPSMHQHQNLTQAPIITTHQVGTTAIAKKKPKKKKQKLDLANIMKLSGIGDEDDIQFESDTSQSESEPNSVHSHPNTPQPQQSNLMQQPQNIVQSNILQSTEAKKIGNIQISAMPQQTINAATTPLVQVLNQSFQSGVIPTSQSPQAQGIPFNPFITPNFTINNGLMVQRSGGYKLTLGEDGRLVLQHDPNLNQDIPSQLLLQNLFGLNSLILQPSMDQQVHSQTVQTIQQQSVQTIQQQTVQSQTIQTVQQQTVQPHSLQAIQPQIQAVQPQTVQQTVQQTIQHQTVQSQPLSALQQHAQPMQIVQPQPIQNLNQSIQSQTVHSIQSQVQPSLHSIQSQIQGQIQSQIQGQIQSILQSQLHSQNMAQGTPTLSTPVHSQPLVVSSQPISIQSQPISIQSQPVSIHSQPISIQSIQSQPVSIHSQPISIQSQPISIQSQPVSIHSQPISIQSQPISIQSQQAAHPHIHHIHQTISNSQPQPQIQSQPSQIQQSVQSQGIQTVHSQPMQTIQSQPVLKVQPFQKTQPPVQTVHPQPMHHPPNQANDNQNPPPPPASYVVNLTTEQLEQLKSNGQVTVNGQTIYMQRSSMNKVIESANAPSENKVKLSPKSKPVKKITKITNTTKVMPHEVKTIEKAVNNVKDGKSTLVSALQTPPKHVITQNRIQVQPQQQTLQPIAQKQTNQPSALIQPSVQNAQIPQPKTQVQQQPKVQIAPSVQNVQTTQAQTIQNHIAQVQTETANANLVPTQEVDNLLGQIIEESANGCGVSTQTQQLQPQTQPQQQQQQQQQPPPQQPQAPPQRVHTIQLTPEKQQHLKSIQLQIQTLSQRITAGDTEMHNALSMLFQEQQKILASGKLLPPDKVYYHNNQLTIVNPSSLSQISNKNEQLQVARTVRSTASETVSSHQIITSQNVKISPTSSCTTETPHSVTVTTTTAAHQHPAQPPQQAIGPPRPTAPTSVQHQSTVTTSQQTQTQHRFIPMFTKAQLIEQQLNTDQNGAVKPDVHHPFKDKADACKRLIRYHCFDQPVLSIKDLNKADEIFELTAKHFIGKFSKMVDKYRFLRSRESMRQVQTSELMMLDRLFLAEEQQSLIRLRQDVQEAQILEMTPPPPPTPDQQNSYPSQSNHSNSTASTPQSQPTADDYDEWACIQKELGCLPQTNEESPHPPDNHTQKRAMSGDSRLDTLKKFRVDKHHHVGGKKDSAPGEGQPQQYHQFQQQHLHGGSAVSRQMAQQQRALHNSNNSTQHHFNMQQHIAHHHAGNTSGGAFNVHGGAQGQTNSNVGGGSVVGNSNNGVSGGNGSGTDNIIDEQVQSAIDSILNLQQSLDLEDTVNSMLS